MITYYATEVDSQLVNGVFVFTGDDAHELLQVDERLYLMDGWVWHLGKQCLMCACVTGDDVSFDV